MFFCVMCSHAFPGSIWLRTNSTEDHKVFYVVTFNMFSNMNLDFCCFVTFSTLPQGVSRGVLAFNQQLFYSLSKLIYKLLRTRFH